MQVWRMSLQRTKSAIISWAGSIIIMFVDWWRLRRIVPCALRRLSRRTYRRNLTQPSIWARMRALSSVDWGWCRRGLKIGTLGINAVIIIRFEYFVDTQIRLLLVCSDLSVQVSSKHSLKVYCWHILLKGLSSQLYDPYQDKTNKMTKAPSEDSDQPGHPPSLISLHCVLFR